MEKTLKLKSDGYRIFFLFFVFVHLIAKFVLFIFSGVSNTIKSFLTYYWNRKARFVIDAIFVSAFVCAVVAGIRIHNHNVNSEIDDSVVSAIDESSTFKRNFNRRRASKTSREFMNVGAPEWLRKASIRAIITESRNGGLDIAETAVLLAIADRESGFNPLAKAKNTTACGVFQFLEGTGKRFGLHPSECFSPYANARAQVKHFKKIAKKIEKKIRGKIGMERLIVMYQETYCMHHDGVNSKKCSVNASETASRGLKLLFTSYNVLLNAEQNRKNDPGFAGKIIEVAHEGYTALQKIVINVNKTLNKKYTRSAQI